MLSMVKIVPDSPGTPKQGMVGDPERKKRKPRHLKTSKSFTQRAVDYMYGSHVTKLLRLGQTPEPYIMIPGSRLDAVHHLIIFLCVLYSLIITPYYWAFGKDGALNAWTVAREISIEMIFIADIVLQFRTAFHDPRADNRLVMDPARIAKQYTSTFFMYDLFGSLPIDTLSVIMEAGGRNEDVDVVLSATSIVKLLRVLRLVRWYNANPHSSITGTYLIMLFVVFFMSTHWLSCLWFAVSSRTLSSEDNWYFTQHSMSIESDGKFKLYVATMYSMLSSILGENIQPQKEHSLLAFIIAFGGSIFFATLMGSMTAYISKLDDGRAAFNDQLADLIDSMKYVKLPVHIQNKVVAFNNYIYNRYKGKDLLLFFKGQDSTIPLSHSLRSEIIFSLHAGTVYNCPLFDHCSPRFIFYMVSCLQMHLATPDEIIFEKGDDSSDMFFIVRGEVAVVDEVSRAHLFPIRAGHYFGEIGLALKRPRLCSMEALTYVELQRFSRDSWETALTEYPAETEKIIHIALQHALKKKMNANKQENISEEGLEQDIHVDGAHAIWQKSIARVMKTSLHKNKERFTLHHAKRQLRKHDSRAGDGGSFAGQLDGPLSGDHLRQVVRACVSSELRSMEAELRVLIRDQVDAVAVPVNPRPPPPAGPTTEAKQIKPNLAVSYRLPTENDDTE